MAENTLKKIRKIKISYSDSFDIEIYLKEEIFYQGCYKKKT